MNIEEKAFKVYRWRDLLYSSDLNHYAKSIGVYISKFTNDKKTVAWPSQKTIKRETSLSNGTVNQYLKLLEKNEWIIRISGNSKKSTRYFLSLPVDLRQEMDLPSIYYDKTSQYYIGNLPALKIGLPSGGWSIKSTPTGGEALHHTDRNKLNNKSVNKLSYDLPNKDKKELKNNSRQGFSNVKNRIPEYVSNKAWNKFTEHLYQLGIQLNSAEQENCFLVLSNYCEFEQVKVVEQSVKQGWSCLQVLDYEGD